MKYDVVIVGAGPGGLHCGEILARNGVRVLILEKNSVIGKKICAGGITWKGLIERIPESLIERSFCEQIVQTRFQKITVRAHHPIIATVNRRKLGQFMADSCLASGTDIILNATVCLLQDQNISYRYKNKTYTVSFNYLVGADGSMSKVRKWLKISTERMGIAINYSLPLSIKNMEWHFDATTFGSGYGWIFPHSNSVSVGGYLNMDGYKAIDLKNNIISWLKTKNLNPTGHKPEAEKISCDYRGWKFGNHYLIGDAAGLASPLTGEGIFPAFVSAEAVAHSILNRSLADQSIKKLVKKHQVHTRMHRLACQNKPTALVLSEISALLLRSRILSFKPFEMA